PGDSYVDWTCIDAYNWGTHPDKPNVWKSFYDTFKPTYDTVMSFASSKPMVIGETASTEYGGSKASWITNMLATDLPRLPKIRAFVWQEKWDANFDWPIETSSSAKSAFYNGIRTSRYTANSYA